MNKLKILTTQRIVWMAVISFGALLQSATVSPIGSEPKDNVYTTTTQPVSSLEFSVTVSRRYIVTMNIKNLSPKELEVPRPLEQILSMERLAQASFPVGVKVLVEKHDGKMATSNQVDKDGWYTPLYRSSQATPITEGSSTKIAPGGKLQIEFPAYSLMYGLFGFEIPTSFPSGSERFRLLFPGAGTSGSDLITNWIEISAP